jgi:hypothetical protein
MNWLRKWLNRRHDRYAIDSEVCVKASSMTAGNKVRSNYEDDGAINFRIYSANGGKIVEAMSYDQRMGREKTNLYIISDDDDFNDSLSKIITLEYIR